MEEVCGPLRQALETMLKNKPKNVGQIRPLHHMHHAIISKLDALSPPKKKFPPNICTLNISGGGGGVAADIYPKTALDSSF